MRKGKKRQQQPKNLGRQFTIKRQVTNTSSTPTTPGVKR